MADPVSWLMIEPGWQVSRPRTEDVGRVDEVTRRLRRRHLRRARDRVVLFKQPRYVPSERRRDRRRRVRLTLDRAAVEQLTSSSSPRRGTDRTERRRARAHRERARSGTRRIASLVRRILLVRSRRPSLTDALDLAAQVRAATCRRVSYRSAIAHRGDEPRAQLPRHRLLRAGARDRAERRAVHRRADARQGSDRDRRRAHDLLLARVRRLRADGGRGGRPPHEGRRLRRARQVEHAGVREHVRHRVGAQRRVPQPVGHDAHARRFVRRRSCCGRRRRAAARARLRRRRLDPHSRLVLRPLRDQAFAWTRLPRSVRQRLARAVAERAALA